MRAPADPWAPTKDRAPPWLHSARRAERSESRRRPGAAARKRCAGLLLAQRPGATGATARVPAAPRAPTRLEDPTRIHTHTHTSGRVLVTRPVLSGRDTRAAVEKRRTRSGLLGPRRAPPVAAVGRNGGCGRVSQQQHKTRFRGLSERRRQQRFSIAARHALPRLLRVSDSDKPPVSRMAIGWGYIYNIYIHIYIVYTLRGGDRRGEREERGGGEGGGEKERRRWGRRERRGGVR